MDLAYSSEYVEFREELRSFLAENRHLSPNMFTRDAGKAGARCGSGC